MTTTTGIHHLTAVTADARRNVAFYTGLLGLRLVKRTVNQDDPTTYHLYYGDELGRPGTILTFFPWQGIRRGRIGPGQASAIAFAIPRASLGWWLERLVTHGIAHLAPERRFGENVVRFHDPDGLPLELVAVAEPAGTPWGGGVPAEHAIRGFHGVTLWVDDAAPTAAVLTGVLGLRAAEREGSLARYRAAGDGPGTIVDLRSGTAGFPRGLMGGGTVHHVAWRAADEQAQAETRRLVEAAGLQPTASIERFYFRSVYFREAGGILFELATDAPGFTVDEPAAELGRTLALPPWLEPDRAAITRALPSLAAPGVEAA